MKLTAFDGNTSVSIESEILCSTDPEAILVDIHTATDLLIDLDTNGCSVNGAPALLHRLIADLSAVALALPSKSAQADEEESSHEE